MIILDWKSVAENIQNNLKKKFQDSNWKYIWILLLSDDEASKTYVKLKRKFWKSIWVSVNIYWKWNFKNKDTKYIHSSYSYDYSNVFEVKSLINLLNIDDECIWIVVQLPLEENLMKFKSDILSTISPEKDIDWLGWVLFWLSTIDLINFVPATPLSVLKLLEHYKLDNFKWKQISIIWQSNLIWKPLALEIIKRYWTVYSFNEFSDITEMKKCCVASDYIITATWKKDLVDKTFLNWKWNQIIIDVWWWKKDWKVAWDVNYESVKNRVYAISPVPWWIWPLTVACLFDNIFIISQINKQYGYLWKKDM